MTDKSLLTLLSQKDLESLRLTADDLDRLLLGKLEHYDAQDDPDQPIGDAAHQPSQ